MFSLSQGFLSIIFLLVNVQLGLSASTVPKRVVQIHGHRGSRGTHPENTLPAFEEAMSIPADFIELDTVLSKDGILIVSHDPYIDGARCKDPNGKQVTHSIAISSLTAEQISKYDCGSTPNPGFPEQKLVPGTPKPTLEAVLKLVQSKSDTIQLNIETKMNQDVRRSPDPQMFVEAILTLLKKYNLVERSVLQSFDFRTLTAAKELEPKLRLSALFTSSKRFCEETAKIGASIASPAFKLVNEANVKTCHDLGLTLAPYTPNKEDEWDTLIENGVDAIITDYPRKLAEYLEAKHL